MKHRLFFLIFDDIHLNSLVSAGGKLIIYEFPLLCAYGRLTDKFGGHIQLGALKNGSTSFTIFQPY